MHQIYIERFISMYQLPRNPMTFCRWHHISIAKKRQCWEKKKKKSYSKPSEEPPCWFGLLYRSLSRSPAILGKPPKLPKWPRCFFASWKETRWVKNPAVFFTSLGFNENICTTLAPEFYLKGWIEYPRDLLHTNYLVAPANHGRCMFKLKWKQLQLCG